MQRAAHSGTGRCHFDGCGRERALTLRLASLREALPISTRRPSRSSSSLSVRAAHCISLTRPYDLASALARSPSSATALETDRRPFTCFFSKPPVLDIAFAASLLGFIVMHSNLVCPVLPRPSPSHTAASFHRSCFPEEASSHLPVRPAPRPSPFPQVSQNMTTIEMYEKKKSIPWRYDYGKHKNFAEVSSSFSPQALARPLCTPKVPSVPPDEAAVALRLARCLPPSRSARSQVFGNDKLHWLLPMHTEQHLTVRLLPPPRLHSHPSDGARTQPAQLFFRLRRSRLSRAFSGRTWTLPRASPTTSMRAPSTCRPEGPPLLLLLLPERRGRGF